MKVTRRRFCIGSVGVAAVAGCVEARGIGRDSRRVTAVRSSPPDQRAWEVDIGRRDYIVLEYDPDDDDPSYVRIEDPAGNVVLEEELSGDGGVDYRTEEAGVHTVHMEWGTRARVQLYVLE